MEKHWEDTEKIGLSWFQASYFPEDFLYYSENPEDNSLSGALQQPQPMITSLWQTDSSQKNDGKVVDSS